MGARQRTTVPPYILTPFHPQLNSRHAALRAPPARTRARGRGGDDYHPLHGDGAWRSEETPGGCLSRLSRVWSGFAQRSLELTINNDFRSPVREL